MLQRFLDQDSLDGRQQWTPLTGGPPGSVLRPFLANLDLHPLDRVMAQTAFKAIRYCDDLVILCRTHAEAAAALDLIRGWTAAHGLRLHPETTRIVDASRGGDGVTFFGYRFASGHRYVPPQSLKALRDKSRQQTGRPRSGSLEDIIAELNPMLRGGFGYCKHARFPVLRKIDSFVRRRLRALLRKREKRPGFGVTSRDHKRWPNAFFAAHGLCTLQEAYVQASQSR